ncbi:hypothetical protein [Mucilaginibacter paludis]|uniref:Uncharacterized protein n=1 Tax=Mucilaginibacter paludis DSM 18603 TaxID=714943 RepID=H1Y0C2_9SPHI|nr:hypothetical protein [Mucilaginibacter paludis]EHQ28171.1 hypothetical protein Mucpa_4080 [Mucilaginibacter paludis DSM 18603]
MLRRIILAQIKKHRIATFIYTLYIALWMMVAYLTYHFLIKGDSETVGTITYYSLLISLPYLCFNMVFAYRLTSRKSKWFFSELSYFIALPIGIVILIYIAHAFIGYMNMGM